MTDPRLLGVLERLTYALEEHVKLLRAGLELLRQLVDEPNGTSDPETPGPFGAGAGICSCSPLYGDALHDRARRTTQS